MSAQGRVQRGVPAGGQFAVQGHSEADVSLAPAPATGADDPEWFEAENGAQLAETIDGYLLAVREKDMGHESGPIQQWEVRHEHAAHPLRTLAFGTAADADEAKAQALAATRDGLDDADTETPRVPKDLWLQDGFLGAVQMARQHIPLVKQSTVESAWSGHVITRNVDPDGEPVFRGVSGDAWTEPAEKPMLPWNPPTGEPVAFVDMGGRVSAITDDHDPRPPAEPKSGLETGPEVKAANPLRKAGPFRNGTVTLAERGGGTSQVDARIVGGTLAVHKSLRGNGWALSHVATGRSVVPPLRRKADAEKVARTLAVIDPGLLAGSDVDTVRQSAEEQIFVKDRWLSRGQLPKIASEAVRQPHSESAAYIHHLLEHPVGKDTGAVQ